jgi:hypothetical protein
MVPLDPQPGWGTQNALPFWWNKFFNGVIRSGEPGTRLVLPVRGTTVGLFYPLHKSYGTFYTSLDGGPPRLHDAAHRSGYTSSLLGKDLPACEHILTIAVAHPVGKPPAPVRLGYLLVAGETGSSRKLAPQGETDLAAAARRTFRPVPAAAWQWSGPYGGAEKTTGPTADLRTAFPPEAVRPGGAWKPCEGERAVVDFAALTGRSDRGVCYARAALRQAEAGPALLALRIDYFGKLWVNGELVRTIAGGHGHPNTPMLIPVRLRAGQNALLLKVHSGSRGNRFSLFVSE